MKEFELFTSFGDVNCLTLQVIHDCGCDDDAGNGETNASQPFQDKDLFDLIVHLQKRFDDAIHHVCDTTEGKSTVHTGNVNKDAALLWRSFNLRIGSQSR